MTLRPEYSLGHSEYNAFLFAAVGEEKVGLPLTVLTAMTRLGFDPWREAARLSDLPRETAARAFAVTIAMLPEGDWKASESEAIATRLVNWLPGRSTQPPLSQIDSAAGLSVNDTTAAAPGARSTLPRSTGRWCPPRMPPKPCGTSAGGPTTTGRCTGGATRSTSAVPGSWYWTTDVAVS